MAATVIDEVVGVGAYVAVPVFTFEAVSVYVPGARPLSVAVAVTGLL